MEITTILIVGMLIASIGGSFLFFRGWYLVIPEAFSGNQKKSSINNDEYFIDYSVDAIYERNHSPVYADEISNSYHNIDDNSH